jgi:hypothetical protein
MMFLGKITACFMLSLLAVFASGCVEIHQEMTIQRDGSGVVKVHLVITKTMLDLRDTALREGRPLHPRANFPLTEEDVKKKFADEKDVTVKDIKIGGGDGNHHVCYTLESKNLARLFELCDLPYMNLDKDSQGNYTLWTKRKTVEKRKLTPEEQLEEDEMLRAARKMFKGLKVSLKIIVPGDILETTAHERTTTAAQWTFDIEKDATFLDEEPEIRLKFRGLGLQLREIRALGPEEVAE